MWQALLNDAISAEQTDWQGKVAEAEESHQAAMGQLQAQVKQLETELQEAQVQ